MDFDLYEDLIGEKSGPDTTVSSEEVERWREEVKDTKSKLKRIMAVNESLHKKNEQLETNMTSLIKTCRNEINRKNETIAGLRRELDNIILKRVGTSRQNLRDLLQELKKILREDKPPKLPVPGTSAEKNKGVINITNVPLNEDVYLFKVGNTSFSFVRHGDIRNGGNAGNQVLKIEQRTGPNDDKRTEMPKEHNREERRRSPCRTSRHDNSRSSKSSSKRHSDSSRRCSKDRSPRKRSVTEKSERNSEKHRRESSSSTSSKRSKTDHEKSEKKRGLQPDDLCDVETTDLEHLLAEKKRMLNQLAAEESKLQTKTSPQTASRDKENASVEATESNTLDNGLQNSSGFLDSWTEASFSSYKTPPSKSRQRTESEHSSGDFSSVAGIAQILKGKLVPSNSTQVKTLFYSNIQDFLKAPLPFLG